MSSFSLALSWLDSSASLQPIRGIDCPVVSNLQLQAVQLPSNLSKSAMICAARQALSKERCTRQNA
jgi:hypothetical protein